ncbi:ribonuclease HIII [Scopulibacillus darangshiensis]|uniref:Ribonuclease HIII n=1 Tax=Scopulibacillus darangshiensis TaxID=442528 RepID=A0A4R2PCN0_9BACL|nr:ribonuclease HIII [Scopulibacillus darangshiensis]TCP32124.1 ribonuclease HIII [Scopulibacillus darangshiensis]
MGHAVLKMDQSQILKMKAFYKSHLLDKNAPGSLFVAKSGSTTITAYKSGKVLFQGKTAEAEAAKWGTVQATAKGRSKKSRSVSGHNNAPPKNISELAIIGSDEVGTGDYFGPITVAAVFCGPQEKEMFTQIGVRDSKALTDPQIVRMAKTLISHDVIYSLLTLNNEKYNDLQAKGFSQGKMKGILHNQAIGHVISKLEDQQKGYDGILIDQFAMPNVYYSYIKDEKQQIKDRVYFQTKAESYHLSVAAASIIARYAFLNEMDQLSDTISMRLPKGAGSNVDAAAAKVIRDHGEKALYSLAKVHFANTKKAKRLRGQTP